MKFVKSRLAASLVMALAIGAQASVSSQEAAKLGTSLTLVGAEKAGNADGSIPAYEGGLTTAPASFKTGDSMRPDPFAGEKPLLVINGKNVDQYKACSLPPRRSWPSVSPASASTCIRPIAPQHCPRAS